MQSPVKFINGYIMTRTHSCTIALALASLFAGHAMADGLNRPLTRDQVKAELAEAIRTGNISVDESGLKLNEQFPDNYPAPKQAPSKSREEVQAELAEAIRTGNISANESGLKLREQFPNNYPAQKQAPGKSREEVQSELAEAISTGRLDAGIEA